MNQTKLKAILHSYLRAAFAAAMALYMAGETDPKALGSVALAAVLGPLMKALDKSSEDFGRGSKK